jgi:prophage regulatory protein
MAANITTSEIPKFIRLPRVKELCAYSRSSIYLQIAQGKFPRPVDLGGGRAVAWLESEIVGWINARVTSSRSGGASENALPTRVPGQVTAFPGSVCGPLVAARHSG